MGIEFREGSLVLNAKNQYKLKKGEFTLTPTLYSSGLQLQLLSLFFFPPGHFCLICVYFRVCRHGAEHQSGPGRPRQQGGQEGGAEEVRSLRRRQHSDQRGELHTCATRWIDQQFPLTNHLLVGTVQLPVGTVHQVGW